VREAEITDEFWASSRPLVLVAVFLPCVGPKEVAMSVMVRRMAVLLTAILFLPVLLAQDLCGETSASADQAARVRIVRVEGSHYEVGFQLGTELKANLVRSVRWMQEQKDWESRRAEAQLFLAISKEHVPEYVAEVQGAADAAGLELGDLFTTICEEIGDPNYRPTKGCSDLIASDDVTRDGSVLVAHNNDTHSSTEERVTIIHYRVDGEPEIVGVGYGGLGMSVGYNSAGISLTGNQLDSNDMRPGVPRMLLVRKILAANSIVEAIEAAILKPRASNYNQVITDANGEAYSIEGSATDYEALYAEDGYLVHTNHYTSLPMRHFEFEREWIASSIVRYNRGRRLMKNQLGKITVESLTEMLSDHVGHPRSICRHGSGVKTTFSVVIDLTSLTMYLAWGNPCESDYAEYRLIAKE
jgi:isopenicillin-N N-acyltransferase-like protein